MNLFDIYYSLTPTVHSYVLGLLKFKPFSERKICWVLKKVNWGRHWVWGVAKLDKIALKDQFIESSHVKVL